MSDDETVVRQRLLRLLGRHPEPPVRPSVAAGHHAGEPIAADGAPTPEPTPTPSPSPSLSPSQSPSHAPTVASPRLGAGAFDPGRRGVKALAVVAAVVVLGAAGWAWHFRPHAQPIAVAASAAPPGSVAGDGVQPEATAAELVVAVAGKVRRPGLVRLPAGARVADALAAAGGALPGADIALLNLARKVSDGELILVGVTPPPGGQPGPAAGGEAGVPGGKVNLNTATLAQLDTLPGVGPVLAQRILAHRERHGAFRSVRDLRQVDGIGDARFEQLKDLVTV